VCSCLDSFPFCNDHLMVGADGKNSGGGPDGGSGTM